MSFNFTLRTVGPMIYFDETNEFLLYATYLNHLGWKLMLGDQPVLR